MRPTPPNPTPPSAATVAVDHRGARGRAVLDRHGWEVELTSGGGRLDVSTASSVLDQLVGEIARHGGGIARWRVSSATAEHHRIATSADFSGRRRLVQMRCALPLRWAATIATRPFRPGGDDDDWLRVNNAAFDWHPEQGGWGHHDLQDRIAASWFDAEGFLLHPVEGPIDGFCWTKVHHHLDPPIGEIFVIGVHPDATGRGLGRELVLAGLEHLARKGIGTAMLYTEADNEPARSLYDRLGFTVDHEVTVFERTVPADAPNSDPDTDE